MWAPGWEPHAGKKPLGVTKVLPSNGPELTMRFNLYRAAQINATAAPGYSSRDVMSALEDTFADTMPREMGFDYAGMSFQEKQAQEGVPPAVMFGMSVLCSEHPSRSSAPSRRCGREAWRTTSMPRSAW